MAQIATSAPTGLTLECQDKGHVLIPLWGASNDKLDPQFIFVKGGQEGRAVLAVGGAAENRPVLPPVD